MTPVTPIDSTVAEQLQLSIAMDLCAERLSEIVLAVATSSELQPLGESTREDSERMTETT